MTDDADPFVAAMVEGETRFELAEGIRWYAPRFVFVDILNGRAYELSVDGSVTPLIEVDPLPLGSLAPRSGHDGEWIVAAGTGFGLVRAGSMEWLGRLAGLDPELHRMNDAGVDPAGRMWAGSMRYDGRPGGGALHFLDKDGKAHSVLTGLDIPNGPVFSNDGETMFLADSAKGEIWSFRLDLDTGDVGEKRLVKRLETGSPDGMIVDSADMLWTAVWGSSQVLRLTPDGHVASEVRLAASQPTSVAIGGNSGQQLAVTSARYGLEQPSIGDGALWVCDVDVTAPTLPEAILS